MQKKTLKLLIVVLLMALVAACFPLVIKGARKARVYYYIIKLEKGEGTESTCPTLKKLVRLGDDILLPMETWPALGFRGYSVDTCRQLSDSFVIAALKSEAERKYVYVLLKRQKDGSFVLAARCGKFLG